jgi:hypothetical protein
VLEGITWKKKKKKVLIDIEAEINKMKTCCTHKELTEEEIAYRDHKNAQKKVK